MLKSFIQLDLQSNHDKSEYQIKKNKLIVLNGKILPEKDRCENDGDKFKTSTFSRQTQSSYMKQSLRRRLGDKEGQQSVNFDCITYDYKSTNQKLLYELVMLNSTFREMGSLSLGLRSKVVDQEGQVKKMTICYNYDIEYEKLEELLMQLMEIKKFQTLEFKIAHFQLRSNHISDYNKPQPQNTRKRHDQMDTFTKQIDTCIKLDKAYNIRQNITFKTFNRSNYKSKDILNKNSRTNYDKKTNEFFIIDIGDQYELDLIILHRQKDYVLTKIEEKEIQQAFILYKGIKGEGRQKPMSLEFNTSLAEIIQSFLLQSNQVILVSQYPTLNNLHSLTQQLRVPLLIDPNYPSSIDEIILEYNKEKSSLLEIEMEKMKVKLRQIRYKRKTTQENIGFLMKKYKKGFESIFESLSYLKRHNISDIKACRDNLQIQIKQKQQDIKQTLQSLKYINYQIIQSNQNHQYFLDKMETLKDSLEQDLQNIQVNYQTVYSKTNPHQWNVNIDDQALSQQQPTINHLKLNKSSPSKTPKRSTQKPDKSNQQLPSTGQLTQTLLNKFIEAQQATQNPYQLQLQRQVDRYTNQLREKTRERLKKSKQVQQFHTVMQDLKKKLSKHQFNKLQQKYLALISMC